MKSITRSSVPVLVLTGVLTTVLTAALAAGPASPATGAEALAQRATRLSVNATPEPVDENGKVTVKGTLRKAVSGGFVPYRGKRVSLSFDPLGPGKVKAKGYVVTDADGRFSATFKQGISGKWIARFAGNASYAASTKSDYVAVAYANCTALTQDHPAGVAVSAAAAGKQSVTPLVSKATYRANASLDRDKDGTACES